LLLYDKNIFSIVGINVIGLSADNRGINDYVGALNIVRFHPQQGRDDVKSGIGKLDFLWDKGALPASGSEASITPKQTIAALLSRQGYLAGKPRQATSNAITAAENRFKKVKKIPSDHTGLQLLGDLILSLK